MTYSFRDPCWLKAGEYLQRLIDPEPFQDGFLATPAQQGATSSAGLVANGNAAMELMGHWNPGVMQSLTPDNKVPSFLGWFPFPDVPGGKGIKGSLLGGGDGYRLLLEGPAAGVRAVPGVHRQPERPEAGRGVGLRPAGPRRGPRAPSRIRTSRRC